MNDSDKMYDVIVVGGGIPGAMAVGDIGVALTAERGDPVGDVDMDILQQKLINQSGFLALDDFQSLE